MTILRGGVPLRVIESTPASPDLEDIDTPSSPVAFPVVAIVGASARWPALRESVDRLGHPSTLFESLSALVDAFHAGRQFALLLLTLPSDDDVRWLLAIRMLTGVPMLFAVDTDSVNALRRIGDEYAGQNNFDFVLAPFSVEEVKSRVQFLLKKSTVAAPAEVESPRLVFQDYRFHCEERQVFFKEKEVHLQPREYEIALNFFRNMNRLLSREALHAALRFDQDDVRSRTLDVYISRIRRKLQIRPVHGLMLTATYKKGYQLSAMASDQTGPQ